MQTISGASGCVIALATDLVDTVDGMIGDPAAS